MSKNKYLAIDPGFTSGYATFDENGKMTAFGQIANPDDMMDWIEELRPEPDVIILEDYVIRKNVSHAGSRAPTIQLIGMIKRYAKKKAIKVVLQMSHAKNIGYKFAGLVPTKNHDQSHQYDAIAHGCYYLQKNGIRESRIS